MNFRTKILSYLLLFRRLPFQRIYVCSCFLPSYQTFQFFCTPSANHKIVPIDALLANPIILIIWILSNKGMEIEEQRPAISLIMALLLHLLTNSHCLEDFWANCTSYLFLLTYIYLLIKSVCWKFGHKQFDCFLTRLISFDLKWHWTLTKFDWFLWIW